MKQKEKAMHILIACALVYLCLHLFLAGITSSDISFDGGWNAQVSRHYAETGKYAVTWPDEIVFYSVITSGQTLLWPTAMVFRVFGVSFETIAIIPVLYSVFFLVILFLLIRNELLFLFEKYRIKNKLSHGLLSDLISCIIVYLFYVFINLQSSYSYDLCGEVTALFYISLSIFCLQNYFKKEKGIFLVVSGFSCFAAILTKLVVICFSVSSFIILALILLREKKCKDLLLYIMGIVLSVISLDTIFKLHQLKWNVYEYCRWWKTYFGYCFGLNQAGDSKNIYDKITNFSHCFGQNGSLGLILLILTFLSLVIFGVLGVFFNKWLISKTTLIMGSGGSAFLLIVLFFGGTNSINVRRIYIHFVMYCICLAIVTIGMFVVLLSNFRRKEDTINLKMKFKLVILVMLVLLGVTFHKNVIKNFPKLIKIDRTELRKRQDALYEVACKLPKNAKCITQNWEFASDITTLCGIPVISEDKIDFASDDEYYYISSVYLSDEVFEKYDYEIIYQEDEDTFMGAIVKITGFRN